MGGTNIRNIASTIKGRPEPASYTNANTDVNILFSHLFIISGSLASPEMENIFLHNLHFNCPTPNNYFFLGRYVVGFVQASVHKGTRKPDCGEKCFRAKRFSRLCLRKQNPKALGEHVFMLPGLYTGLTTTSVGLVQKGNAERLVQKARKMPSDILN